MNRFHEAHAYSKQQMLFQRINFPATLPVNQSFYQPKISTNSESGLTCNIPATRKRSRDEFYGGAATAQKSNQFIGGNKLPQIELEMDALIFEHTKKIRLELQERQKQEAKVLVARMGESMEKTLREKDDHIEKLARLNVMLEEKAKGLCVENQLWREMAQTNEAAANSLRTQLQHALAQFGVAEEQVESCGSCNYIDGGETTTTHKETEKRLCRMCGERQCCVVLLPCRHLCLCGGCGRGSHQLQDCPVCNATMTATLHVNIT